MKKKYRFGLRKKLIFFTTILAIITYSMSALFLYVVYDYITQYWSVSKVIYLGISHYYIFRKKSSDNVFIISCPEFYGI